MGQQPIKGIHVKKKLTALMIATGYALQPETIKDGKIAVLPIPQGSDVVVGANG